MLNKIDFLSIISPRGQIERPHIGFVALQSESRNGGLDTKVQGGPFSRNCNLSVLAKI